MTIEIHNAELEAILLQKKAAGGFASIEDLLADIVRESDNRFGDVDARLKKAQQAAAAIREIQARTTSGRPEGMTLREYTHLGHKY